MKPGAQTRIRQQIAEALIRRAGPELLTRAATALEAICLYTQGVGSAALDVIHSGEVHVLQLVAAAGAGPIVVFDVGANVGSYTDLACRALGSRARVHSFEPNPYAYAALQANCSGLSNVWTYETALGDRGRDAVLFMDSPLSTVGSLSARAIASGGRSVQDSVQVSVTTVDEQCKLLGIETVDLLKIDAEGADLEVLAGAGYMLDADRIRFVQFEFGFASLESRTYFRDFIDRLPHFEFFRVVPSGLIPVGPYRPHLEKFVSATNYVAISRTAAKRGP